MTGRHRATHGRQRGRYRRRYRGRHRAPSTTASWLGPTALGTVVAGALALTLYATNGLAQDGDALPAAMALETTSASPTPSPTSSIPPSTSTKSTTSTTPEPSETSATPTTTESTETVETAEIADTTETAAAEPAESATPEPEPCSTDLEGTQPHVAQVGHHILTKFDVDAVGGRAERSNPSDHPLGLALDFMVSPDVGDALAEYVLEHREEFGVTYVIWQQRINSGSGWTLMEDRGSPTANHMDHVHVSFAAGVDVSVTC